MTDPSERGERYPDFISKCADQKLSYFAYTMLRGLISSDQLRIVRELPAVKKALSAASRSTLDILDPDRIATKVAEGEGP